MKEILIKQIDFDYWANKELLSSMRLATQLESRSQLLFSHIVSINSRLLNMIKAETIVNPPFQDRTLDESEELLELNNKNWIDYMVNADLNELNRIVEFTFVVDNTLRKMSVSDFVLHMAHHSSYHRGQIITQLKGRIETLPLVTYIKFASEIT